MSAEEWIYGLNPVLEALRAGRTIKTVYVSAGRHAKIAEIRREADARGISIEAAGRDFFDGRFPKGHQGVAARVNRKAYLPLEELLMIPAEKKEEPLFLVLDGIEDPRNFGAILRSAEAAGVHGVVIQAHRSAGLGAEVTKASAGASEYVPVAMVPNVKHAMREMREQGIRVIGAEVGEYPVVWDADLSGPLSLVIGSEGKGARRTVRQGCDGMVSIPARGKVNSLNVSVAAGILLFEILRQRWTKREDSRD